jgi:hypothetical protein
MGAKRSRGKEKTPPAIIRFLEDRRDMMRQRVLEGQRPMGIVTRVAGSIVVGWILGAAIGLGISRIVHDGGADQLPIITIPTTIVIVFIASFFLPRRRY